MPEPESARSAQLWLNVVEIWVAAFSYGLYCILFARCIYILRQRMRQLERQGILLSAITTLFALSTIQIVALTVQSAAVFGQFDISLDNVGTASVLIYVSSCVCSDALLIYRCYVIWGDNRYIVAAPLLLLVNATVFGYLQKLTVLRILSLSTIVSVTLLTVSRIGWAAYQRRGAQLTGELRQKYITASSTILESGGLYTLFVVVHFALFSLRSTAAPIVFAAVSQVVGIAPTLIFVRVGLETRPPTTLS
ncbi:hypothetical protein FB451DRAFT_1295195 [Mycena latifolia]|nr:hypothetical protein FB451DRAFT_1295195 [Mycena latifolia]